MVRYQVHVILAYCLQDFPASLCLPCICPLLSFQPGWVKSIIQPKRFLMQKRAVTAQLGTGRDCSWLENTQLWPEKAKPYRRASWRGFPVPPTGWVILLSVFFPAATAAVYKQWIPNTNFETASNWDKGRVPCASDVVHFEKNKVLDIFIAFLFHFL